MAASDVDGTGPNLRDDSGCITQVKQKRSPDDDSMPRKREKKIKTSKDLLNMPEAPWKHLLVCDDSKGSKRAHDRAAASSPWTMAGRPSIGPVPESSLLSQVRNFLPVMRDANDQLRAREEEGRAHELDIELITGGENAPHILMDVALGVAELRTPEAVEVAQRLVNGSFCPPINVDKEALDVSSDDEDEDDSSDSDTKSHKEEDDELLPQLRHERKRGKRIIEEL